MSDDFNGLQGAEYLTANLTPSLFFTAPFLIFSAVFLFLALLYDQQALTVFSFSLIVLAAFTKLWSRLSPRGVVCRVQVDRNRVFPGEPVDLVVTVENKKVLPVFVRIGLSVSGFSHSQPTDALLEEEGGLLWHQTITFSPALTAQRRGVYRIGSSSLTTGDLFGIFPRTREIHRPVDVIVYPRIVRIQPFPILKRIVFGKPGTASPVCDPVYFLGTRDYQHHQPARYMDWKASARHNRLQEKIFEPVEQDKVLLVLDVDGFADHGADDVFEQVIEAMAALIVALDARHYAVGFFSNGGCGREGGPLSPVRKMRGQLTELFDRLARIQMRPIEKMAAALHRADPIARNVSCVYFSYDRNAENRYFQGRHIPTVHILADADRGREAGEPEGEPGAGRIYYLEDVMVK